MDTPMFTATKLHILMDDDETTSTVNGYYVQLNKRHYIVKEHVEDAEKIDIEYCPGGYSEYLAIEHSSLTEIDPDTLKYIGSL